MQQSTEKNELKVLISAFLVPECLFFSFSHRFYYRNEHESPRNDNHRDQRTVYLRRRGNYNKA